MLIRALVLLDPAARRRRLVRLLDALGVMAVSAPPPRDAEADLLSAAGADVFDLVLLEEALLPQPAESFFAALQRLPERPDALVLRRGEDPAARAGLLAAGALAVLDPDLPEDALGEALATLVERRRRLGRERLAASPAGERRQGLSDLIAVSPAMRRLVTEARRVADSDATVFLLGETGAGKEWLARAIHADSRRSEAPFLAVNCAALPDTLLESELFGHEQGAFTGAVRSRRGHFELAHGGTLFLDEIAELPPALQGKLLRALQERTIQRLGSEKTVPVDVRILAATSRDVERALEDGSFRPDLYYRLAVVTLTVPPLRERREDLPALVAHHLERIGRGPAMRGPRSRPTLDAPALEALAAYPWPGNVRELANVLERTVLLTPDSEITLEDLPLSVQHPARRAGSPAAARPDDENGDSLAPLLERFLGDDAEDWLGEPLPDVLRRFHDAVERHYLDRQLRACHGRVGEVARRAGIEVRSLYDRMKRHGLRKEDYR